MVCLNGISDRRFALFGQRAIDNCLADVDLPTADVSRGRHLNSHKTTSEQRAQKFHTDDVHYPDLGSASDWLKENSNQSEALPRSG